MFFPEASGYLANQLWMNSTYKMQIKYMEHVL